MEWKIRCRHLILTTPLPDVHRFHGRFSPAWIRNTSPRAAHLPAGSTHAATFNTYACYLWTTAAFSACPYCHYMVFSLPACHWIFLAPANLRLLWRLGLPSLGYRPGYTLDYNLIALLWTVHLNTLWTRVYLLLPLYIPPAIYFGFLYLLPFYLLPCLYSSASGFFFLLSATVPLTHPPRCWNVLLP